MTVFIWKLKENFCTGCGICNDICNEGAILMTKEMPLPRSVAGKCSGCMNCIAQCPFDAITVDKVKPVDN